MGTVKKRTPRVEIRRQDNVAGKYPTIARTGDSRTGRNSTWFTDNDTVMYLTGTAISYPTTLQISSSLLTSEFTSSISVDSANVIKDIEQWEVVSDQLERITPFKEYKHFENDISNSSFALTGTALEIAGDGFTSKLSNKTKIRLEFPLRLQSQLQPASASIYYYNKLIGKFEEVGSSIRHRTMPNFNFWESRLFGPFGNNLLSTSRGSVLNLINADSAVYGPGEGSSRAISYVDNRLGEILTAFSTQSLLINSTFAATSSQYIRASDYISQPFLLEKMSIEIPIKTGRGWHGDITTIVRMMNVSGTGAYRSDPFDCGGPAITFSLLNQLGDGTRDLILSSTIIPSSDNFAGQSFNISPWNERFPRGFLSFGQPSKVIQSESNGTFTGSITLHLEPQLSNGVTSLGFGTPPGGYPPNQGNSFRNSFAIATNPIGRSMKSKQSGRSVFGKEYAMPDSDPASSLYTNFPPATPPLYNDVFIFNYEKSVTSPYLIFPGDNLLLAFSKYRGCVSGSAITSYNFANPMPVAQHDFWINTGSINITLYGSLIQENKEFHDTLNSNLTTDSVNEAIYGDYVLDQWDVGYQEEFTGSYLFSYVSGTFLNGNRGQWYDATAVDINDKLTYSPYLTDKNVRIYERVSNLRNSIFSCAEELEYDSMLPRFDEMIRRENGSPYYAIVGKGDLLVTLDSADSITVGFQTTILSKAFPFEPFYNGLIRAKTIDKINAKINAPFLQAAGALRSGSFLEINEKIAFETYRGDFAAGALAGWGIWGEYKDSSTVGGDFIGLRQDDVIKLLYGFGDMNTVRTALFGQEQAGKYYGTTNRASFRTFGITAGGGTPNYGYGGKVSKGPLIRGWKYGISNGFLKNSRSIFRRDSYGQFRDMLEQRLDTKFVQNNQVLDSPVQVKFIGPSGQIIDPMQTVSSNLSFEATSSLPYFDENVRNREEPISLSSIYSLRFTK